MDADTLAAYVRGVCPACGTVGMHRCPDRPATAEPRLHGHGACVMADRNCKQGRPGSCSSCPHPRRVLTDA
jgi:hypothetical protein